MFRAPINFRIVLKILGFLVIMEGLFMLIACGVSLFYSENDSFSLLTSSLITIGAGGIISLILKDVPKNMGKREGYLIVSLVWIIFSFFGSLPFLISGAIPSFTDAFFETISGVTTTGASILNNIEEIPHGLLFWRSMTQWLGGMGIIVLSLAILPFLGVGGMQLFEAEVPGPTPDKLHPRIKETAKRLWAIYLLFTIAEVLLLVFGGMSFFDAVNHAFTTMATGGYSTKQASIAYYDSAYIQYVITFFMLVAGTNFTLLYYLFHKKAKRIVQNEEFRFYISIIAIFTLVISLGLYFINNEPVKRSLTNIKESTEVIINELESTDPVTKPAEYKKIKAQTAQIDSTVQVLKEREVPQTPKTFEKSFRDATFQVVSIMTTTGYVTADYLSWVPFLSILIFVLMFFGGSAGSTGGGIKVVRIMLLLKNSKQEIKRLLHPKAIIPVRVNHQSVKPEIVSNILAFIVFYLLIFVIGTIIMSVLGLDLDSAMGSVIACLGNIGPGIGSVGPVDNFAHIPVLGKWILSFLMLVGRLELFTVLIIFTRAFWKN